MARRCIVFFIFSLLFFSFVSSNLNNKLNNELFNSHYEFIDLSHPFDNSTVYWPGVQKFEYTKKTEQFFGDDEKWWYATKEFIAGEHGGTHIDAPYHFYSTGIHVGEIPLTKLIVPLIVVDVSSIVNNDPNFVLYKHHLDYILNDNLGKPCVLIFKFGWSKFYNQRNKFLGTNEQQPDKLNFPGLSAEVAEWITTSYKNVVGVGVDVASMDPGSSTDYPVHKIFSRAGLYNMESININRHVPDHGCTALVMPMKIGQGTGAPLRLVAICPIETPTNF